MKTIKLAPSILTADFSKLADEIQAIEKGGADLVHLDIMDGQFVPPITFGADIVSAISKITNLPLEVHLMIMNPERHIESFASAVKTINIHFESSNEIAKTIDEIHRLGCDAGICINPETPVTAIKNFLEIAEQVMVMTINPGWGGQKMMPEQLNKVIELRKIIENSDYATQIEIDGGVKIENIPICVQAGADILVCGSSVYNDQSQPEENLANLRDAIRSKDL
jgi:ribulose-phosphate 3-epimerase